MINNIPLSLEKRISVSGAFWEKRIKTNTADSQILNNSNLDYILETILYGRKIQKDEFDSFLDPKVNQLLNDPNNLIDMDVAVERIVTSMIEKKKLELLVITMLMVQLQLHY